MKSITLQARLYLLVIYLAGIAVLLSQVNGVRRGSPWMLAFLSAFASLALILKVEGTTDQSHYTFSFVIYGFTFAAFGAGDAVLVIVASHLIEWLWYRSSWPMHLFKLSACLVATQLAGLIYFWVNHGSSLITGRDILGLLLGLAAFAALNHWLAGIFRWRVDGANFKRSGVLDFFPFILSLSLLYFGASIAVVWKYNPFAILLLVVPTYFLYSALRVPALQRKTELDSKTGLFNHGYFRRQLDSELARSKRFDRPLSVIIADLDLLRNINNTYGHLAGDEVLIGVANAMKRCVREYDIVSRFGGEEFAILLPETTLMQAYEKAEFFRKTIEAMEFTVPTSPTPIRATMSFGVAHRENLKQSSNEIVHNADLAVYNSKLNGRNRTCAHTKNSYYGQPAAEVDGPDRHNISEPGTPGTYVVETFMQTSSLVMSLPAIREWKE